MNILLIDDNPLDNSGYINELKKFFNVDVAIKLSSAERLLRSKNYKVVVIDVMMPTQGLDTNNEMETGYVFYEERLSKLNLKNEYVFWSNLPEESYENFEWSNTEPPQNSSFLHKDPESEEHLAIYIKKILKNK